MQDEAADPDMSIDSSSISSYRTNGASTVSGSKPPHESSEPVNIPSKMEEGSKQNSLITPPKGSIGRREDIHSPNQPKTLLQEFTLVNFQIPNSNVNVQEVRKSLSLTLCANFSREMNAICSQTCLIRSVKGLGKSNLNVQVTYLYRFDYFKFCI